MHRIDGPGATVDNKFTEGDPVGGVQATVVTDGWLNDVQEEVMSVLSAGGVAPVKGTQDQLLQSLYKVLQAQNATAFSAAGSATTLTLSPSPAISAYATNQRFTVKFPVDSGLNPTINVSAKGQKSLKQYDSSGAKVAAVFSAGQISDIVYDGFDWVLLDQLPVNSLVDPWALQPIGVPIPVFDHIVGPAGGLAPPTDKSYRYIKLTASNSYNIGVLGSESVSGTAPLVLATAIITYASSPINGASVSLINTERRVLRAGLSGSTDQDAIQGHWHNVTAGGSSGYGLTSGGSTAGNAGIDNTIPAGGKITGPANDGTNGAVRVANETRAKSIGVTYYMRIL